MAVICSPSLEVGAGSFWRGTTRGPCFGPVGASLPHFSRQRNWTRRDSFGELAWARQRCARWEVTLGGLGTHVEASGIVAWFEALKRGFKPVLGGSLISDRW